MRIAVIYLFPNINFKIYHPLAKRFVNTYLDNPPGVSDHEFHVAVNGSEVTPDQEKLFHPLTPKFFYHDNSGKDIGAYQVFSNTFDCDLMVCLGAPLRCNRAGWLDRIKQVYEDNGPGLYGCWAFGGPFPHVRTTAFWCPPQLLRSYPKAVSTNMRYEFEHGSLSITNWTRRQGLPTLQVTWSGVYSEEKWHTPTDRTEHLLLDQHCERAGL